MPGTRTLSRARAVRSPLTIGPWEPTATRLHLTCTRVCSDTGAERAVGGGREREVEPVDAGQRHVEGRLAVARACPDRGDHGAAVRDAAGHLAGVAGRR